MPQTPDWSQLLHGANPNPRRVGAETLIGEVDGRTYPVLLVADDGHQYLVKGPLAKRSLIADHIVGELGATIGAPVPAVALVAIPDELMDADRVLASFRAGFWHGSRWIRDCTDDRPMMHVDVPENRSRLAMLAGLYTWLQAADYQFLYSKAEPRLIHSVDHGEFFAGGSDWTVELLASGEACNAIDQVLQTCNLSKHELDPVVAAIAAISPQQIADVVAGVPNGWGLGLQERAPLAEYIYARRRGALAVLGSVT